MDRYFRIENILKLSINNDFFSILIRIKSGIIIGRFKSTASILGTRYLSQWGNV